MPIIPWQTCELCPHKSTSLWYPPGSSKMIWTLLIYVIPHFTHRGSKDEFCWWIEGPGHRSSACISSPLDSFELIFLFRHLGLDLYLQCEAMAHISSIWKTTRMKGKFMHTSVCTLLSKYKRIISASHDAGCSIFFMISDFTQLYVNPLFGGSIT